MARSEARIAVTIWSDQDFLALSQSAQHRFLFLISQPDLAHDGVIALRERRWSKATAGVSAAGVEGDLAELELARFVVVDDDAEELLVRSFIRADKVYRQPNVLLAAADHMRGVTSLRILETLASELDRIAMLEDIPKGSVGTLAEMRGTVRRRLSGGPAPVETPSVDDDARPGPSKIVSADDGGSDTPRPEGSTKATRGAPGERGVVTAVTTASPIPVPLAPGPGPRSTPHSSSGGAGERADATPPAAADPGPEPPIRCPNHIDNPTTERCGACGTARRSHDEWAARATTAIAARRSRQAHDRAEAARAEIDACGQCDRAGLLPGGTVCAHDPGLADRARRGAEAARAALRGGGS